MTDYTIAGGLKGFRGGGKSRRRNKSLARQRTEYEKQGVRTTGRYNEFDPDQAMGALDEFGFTKTRPGRHIAQEMQHLANRKVTARNVGIAGESRDMLLGQQKLLESRRPGGAMAMLSPLVRDAARMNLERRTAFPDLLSSVRQNAIHRANKAAKDAATLAAIGGVVQTVGTAMGAGAGGGGAAGAAAAVAPPGGAAAPAVIGGGPASSAAAATEGTVVGGGAGAAPGAPPAPITTPAVGGGGGGAAPGAPPGGPQPAPGVAPAPGAPAPAPTPAGGAGVGAGGGGAPAPGGGGLPAVDEGGSMGDAVVALDPSPLGSLTATLSELGPAASTVMALAYEEASESVGYNAWLENFWQDID